jgi:GDP-L-fucose synthase
MAKTSKQERVFVAGHTGLVGSAVVRRLHSLGYDNVVGRDISQLDLTDSGATTAFFEEFKPSYVVLAAAKVGGIHANDTYPADFIRINLQIQTNVIDGAHRSGVKKLLFLGSSCIYPKHAPQPMKEEHLLTGTLEPTNDAYAIAKIAGILMTQAYNRQHGTNFIAAMPTNLYGPGDNFDLRSSHVLPAMVRKFVEAKEEGKEEVELWGTGSPRREFLFVDDLADALVFLLENFDATKERDNFVNVGVGEDISIKALAELVQEVVGYEGKAVWNSSMPDGTPRKLLDVTRLKALGWQATTSLHEGIEKTVGAFREGRCSRF